MRSFRQTPRRVIVVSAILSCVIWAVGIVPRSPAAGEATEPVADKPPAKNDPVKLTAAREKILQTLQQSARFEFLDSPLKTIVGSVKDAHRIELQLDEEALRDAGVKSDEPVTVHVVDVNLNNALWLLSRQLGLTHVIRGDDLLITTPQEAERIVREGGIAPDQVKLWSDNDKIFRALAEPTTLEFIETPVQDVMDYLADLHSIPIRLDRAALREAKIGTNLPLTFNIHGVTLNSGLRLMLDEVRLTHVVSHAVLLITTPQERDRLVQHGGFEPDDLRFSPGNKRVFPALAEETHFEFIDTPIQDVADYLQDLHSVLVRFDTRAIWKAGKSTNAPVTKNLRKVTLHSALKEMLGELQSLKLYCPQVTDDGFKHIAVLGTLQSLRLGCPRVTDAGLKHIRGLTRLQELQIYDAQVTDGAFSYLADMKELETLGFHNTNVAGAGLEHLERHQHLRELTLAGSKVSGAKLTYVSGCRHLESLSLSGPGVTDEALKHVARLKHLAGGDRLRELSLIGTQVSDAGLVHLAGLNQLTSLDLSRTRVTGFGLSHVRSPKLFELKLSRSQVTDAGLAHLNGLTALRRLDLTDTQVTDEGLVHLRKWWQSVRAAEAAGKAPVAGGTQFGIVIARNTKITRAAAKELTKEFRKLRVFGVR